MKINLICRSLIIAAAVGVPGFVKFDTTGLTQDFGLINIQSITRMVFFAVIGFLFISLGLLKFPKKSRLHPPTSNFWAIGLLSYYGLFFVLSAIELPMNGFAVAAYRVVEWALVISLCWYYFRSFQISDVGASGLNDDFISCMRWITSLPALVVLAGLIIVPDLAYSYSTETGTFRFGGYLFGPNSLGVICGIGSVLFWILPRRRTDKLWSIALFIFMLLTYSRGAMIAFISYILYYNFIYSSFIRKISSVFLFLVFLIVLTSGIAENFFSGTLTAFSRGDSSKSIATLNSRTVVWDAALKAINDSPWIGHGFIQGPKKLRNYFEQKWWAPPHAHNDILNAGVAGGWVMAVFTLLIFITLAIKFYRLNLPKKPKAVAGSILVQGTLYSILTPVFSTAAYSVGIIMVILIGYLFMQPPLPKKNTQRNQRHAYSYSS